MPARAPGRMTVAATVSDSATAPVAITANSALFPFQNDKNLRDPIDHYSNYSFYPGPNVLVGGALRIRKRAVSLG